MDTTYRIEIRDESGYWQPAPGEASGWNLRDAMSAIRAGVPSMTGEPWDGQVRIVDERSHAIVYQVR